jgi:hypothetical protein
MADFALEYSVGFQTFQDISKDKEGCSIFLDYPCNLRPTVAMDN